MLPEGVEKDRRGEESGAYNKCPMWKSHINLDDTLATIIAQNNENLAVTKQVAEIVVAWNAMKGFISVLNWLAKIAKLLAAIATGIGLAFAFVKWVLRIY
jgi:hypothetical protein